MEEPKVPQGAARALLLVAVLAIPLTAPCLRADAPSRDEAAALFNRFRSSIWQDSTYAEFDLAEMPRRGAERVFRGRFWGSRDEKGPVTRFEVDPSGANPGRRLIIQGGQDGALWVSEGAGAGVARPEEALKPVVPGVEVTPFDLVPMEYLYWIDVDFTGASRVRGRQAFIYMLTPPGDFAAANPGVRGVRVYLDGQYDALEEAETIGRGGGVSKTLSLLELRKVGPRWIPRNVDIRNEATRDKTRLTLTAIAVGITVAPATFDPARLGTAVPIPAGDQLIRITQ